MSSDENASFMALVSFRFGVLLVLASRQPRTLGPIDASPSVSRSARIRVGNPGDKVLVIGEAPILEDEGLAAGKDKALNCRQGNVLKMDGNNRSRLRGHLINH